MFGKMYPLLEGEPGAAGGGDPAGAGAGAPAAGANPPADWTESIADPALKTWVTAKGFKDPASVANSAWNLEKLTGAGLDKLIKMPSDDKPETWNEVYNKLGRPEKPDGYSFKAPEGQPAEFEQAAKTWFHEAGLNDRQAKTVVEKWNAHVEAVTKAQTEAANAAALEQKAKLDKEWGAALEQNLGIAKRAAVEFGMDAAAVDKLQTALGYDGVMKFLHAVGSKIGEAAFHTGDSGRPANFSGVLSPEQARAKIAELRKDSEFTKRYLAKDLGARQEMERLHKWAYPES